MKIERGDIVNEIDRYNHAFRKNVHVPARMIDEWVREAMMIPIGFRMKACGHG